MKTNLLQNLSKTILIFSALVAVSLPSFAQASFDQMKPFGFVTVSSRTDNTKSYDLTGGGTFIPDANAAGAVVLTSTGADMKSAITTAINNNKVIILDGSKGDFIISSVINLSSKSGKTIIGINNARLCTKWYVTDEIKSKLDAQNVKSASTSSGTGGRLSNGKDVSEEAEFKTRQILLNMYGNEDYRNSGIFYVQSCSNIVFRNITFVGPGSIDVSGYDLMSIYGSNHIWVDHCSFIDGIDGNLDITQKADFCTISWCTFHYTDRSYMHQNTNLIGSSDSETAGYLNTTMAYNMWGAKCRARMPMGRVGKIHVLNNYYNCAGNSTACVNPRKNSEFLIEGNYFDKGISKVFTDNDSKAYTWASDNIIGRSGTNAPTSSGTVTVPYDYSVQPAANLPEIISKHAGATLFNESSGIEKITAGTPSASRFTYNLSGQRVSDNAKGIVIMNGKKVIK